MKSTKIGFIGAGNMANSLIRGLIAKGTLPENIWASDLDQSKLRLLAADCSIQTGSNSDVANNSDVIVLAVKPQVMRDACIALAADIAGREVLLVSIAAGITTAHLESWLGESAAIVRCMPNTPALVGKGASGLFANANVSNQQKQLAEEVICAVGFVSWVEADSDIDIVTAVSGSGPAYFFLFMEAMQDAAREMGLSEDLARALTYHTAAGAAALAQHSDEDIATLRCNVTSPGGTTEQAILQLEEGDLRGLISKALNAAKTRSEELAEETDST
ncbi:MAG: pyrroline-5-carboxylate reductase [Pseudohongiella sp.]|nr:MAG: pyrroline-5-carboxylate reductase [Pseudohongiella sp.]